MCTLMLPLTVAKPQAADRIAGGVSSSRPGWPESTPRFRVRRKVCGVPPTPLTSILQVMIPGSLPTALKALLRDMARLLGTETSQSKQGDDASPSRHPSSFPPKSLPNFLSAILPCPSGASLCYFTVMGGMTCPSSHH